MNKPVKFSLELKNSIPSYAIIENGAWDHKFGILD